MAFGKRRHDAARWTVRLSDGDLHRIHDWFPDDEEPLEGYTRIVDLPEEAQALWWAVVALDERLERLERWREG